MALNIKNPAVEQLSANESKTEAFRRALAERKERLMTHRLKAGKQERLEALLRNRIWPQMPARARTPPVQGATRSHPGLWSGGCLGDS